MSRRQRARIERLGPGDDLPRPGLFAAPPGASERGFVRRGDQAGRLLQLPSGRYVLQLDDGALATLDQDKVAALLSRETLT